MKSINLATLLILLVSSASSIETSTPADTTQPGNNITKAKTEPSPMPVKDQQSLITTCYAHRAVMGHDGEIAQWKAKCRVEVWAGDSQAPPELKELTTEQREKVMTEKNSSDMMASGAESESIDQMAEKSRYLVNEAVARHHICMEAKRSILDKLKELLPAGYNSCEKIQEAMQNLKLSADLEMFINLVNGEMKDTVASIHSIEQDPQLSSDQKLERLRDEKIKLTGLLDEQCKDEHPSIRYQNVGYFPPKDIDQAKTTLFTSQSDPSQRFEVVHWPAGSNYSPHYEQLREITNAAAHHAAVSKESAGLYHAYLQKPNQRELDGPFIISMVKQQNNNNENTASHTATNDPDLNSVPDSGYKRAEDSFAGGRSSVTPDTTTISDESAPVTDAHKNPNEVLAVTADTQNLTDGSVDSSLGNNSLNGSTVNPSDAANAVVGVEASPDSNTAKLSMKQRALAPFKSLSNFVGSRLGNLFSFKKADPPASAATVAVPVQVISPAAPIV